MSTASRAKAAAKEDKKWLDLIESNRVKAAEWLSKNINPVLVAANRAGTEHVFEEGEKMEPIPHWVLPIGESLVNPDYFSPPTAEINGKLRPILTVRAFHYSAPEGFVFERAALGSPYVRVS